MKILKSVLKNKKTIALFACMAVGATAGAIIKLSMKNVIEAPVNTEA